MEHFFHVLLHYCYEIGPALAVGFFISGLVHELVPEDIVAKYLGSGNIRPVIWSTVIGTLLPVCCWGSLPIAVSFHKKGAGLGPVLAFLVATPATSISALLATYSVLGFGYAVYTFFAVIIMGIVIGLIGNSIKYKQKKDTAPETCPHCNTEEGGHPINRDRGKRKTAAQRMVAILRYAYIELPKEIGLELVVGILLAAFVAVFVPIGRLIRLYLAGPWGYVFGVIFGILTYLCATASIPLIDSLIGQGLSRGAGMTLLLIGPVTSYGTMLVLKKEFGAKVLAAFLSSLIVLTVILGLGFQLIVK